MKDPIHSPLPAEDAVYGNDGPKIINGGASNKERGEAVIREQERERNELATVLNTEPGQAVLMRLLDHCRIYQSTVNHEKVTYAFAEGRRAVGLWLLDQITRIDPLVYPELLKRHVKRQRDRQAAETGIAQAKKP